MRERLDFDEGIQPRGWCLELVIHLIFMRTGAEANLLRLPEIHITGKYCRAVMKEDALILGMNRKYTKTATA